MKLIIQIIIILSITTSSSMTLSDDVPDPSWDYEYRLAPVLECVQNCCQDWETASYESVPAWVASSMAICIHPDNVQWRFKDVQYRFLTGICLEELLVVINPCVYRHTLEGVSQ